MYLARALHGAQARPARAARADRCGALCLRLPAAARAHQPVHQPAGAQPVHAARCDRAHLVNVQLIIFGPDAQGIRTAYSFDSFQLGPLIVDAAKVYAAAAAVVVAAALSPSSLHAPRQGYPRVRGQLPGRARGRLERQAALRPDLRPGWHASAAMMMMVVIDVTPTLGPAHTLLAFVIVITGGLGRCRERCSAGCSSA